MNEKLLLNSIIGDLCGSIYDNNPIKYEPASLLSDSCHFTDTTVHTIAVANAILENPDDPDFSKFIRLWSKRYPHIRYGRLMTEWINDENYKINSFGCGAAMRVSPCGLLGLISDYGYFNQRNILKVIKNQLRLLIIILKGLRELRLLDYVFILQFQVEVGMDVLLDGMIIQIT